MLHRFADIHTHIVGQPDSILSIPAEGLEGIVLHNQGLPLAERQHYSLQLHPWHLTDVTDVDAFTSAALKHGDDPQLVAIGECGLDSLCPTPIELQHTAFLTALRVARQWQKPVVIHCVKLWAEMVSDVHKVFPELRTQADAWRRWTVIVHGFRKGPELARQLLDAGLSISIGTHYNPQIPDLVPPERLYHETDGMSIAQKTVFEPKKPDANKVSGEDVS